jgi:hypothetical protein
MGSELGPCPRCGALVPEIDGPTHRYIEASPGCWAAYGKLSVKEASDFRYMRPHQLTVDAYCAQYRGRPPGRRSVRSPCTWSACTCSWSATRPPRGSTPRVDASRPWARRASWPWFGWSLRRRPALSWSSDCSGPKTPRSTASWRAGGRGPCGGRGRTTTRRCADGPESSVADRNLTLFARRHRPGTDGPTSPPWSPLPRRRRTA